MEPKGDLYRLVFHANRAQVYVELSYLSSIGLLFENCFLPYVAVAAAPLQHA
jgi:hypothetical protein